MDSSKAFNVVCQQCKTPLVLIADDSLGAIAGPSRLEDSFILLQEAVAGKKTTLPLDSGRRLDESFVLLPKPRAPPSTQRIPLDAALTAVSRVFEAATDATAIDQPLCTECAAEVHKELETELSDLQSEIAAYEAALCRLREEEASQDASLQPLDDADFAAALKSASDTLAQEKTTLAQLELDITTTQAALHEAEGRSKQLDKLEARYWHEFSSHQLSLTDHLEERDRITHAINSATVSLNMLKRTNVYADLFRIWFDGPFGTISGLKLGRTRARPVEWDEINAAWGQAVLLLASLARSCGCRFCSYTLLPAGSYPRIRDDKAAAAGTTHDLFGPVNKLFCTSYDRGQVAFLTCLKEFAVFLRKKGVPGDPNTTTASTSKSVVGGNGAAGHPPPPPPPPQTPPSSSSAAAAHQQQTSIPFQLPWEIDGERVGGQSIRLAFANDTKWTKALKFMLVDLKYCLKGALTLMEWSGGGGGGQAVVSLQREGPSSLHNTEAFVS